MSFVEQFVELTTADREVAEHYERRFRGDLNNAVSAFFDDGSPLHLLAQSPSPARRSGAAAGAPPPPPPPPPPAPHAQPAPAPDPRPRLVLPAPDGPPVDVTPREPGAGLILAPPRRPEPPPPDIPAAEIPLPRRECKGATVQLVVFQNGIKCGGKLYTKAEINYDAAIAQIARGETPTGVALGPDDIDIVLEDQRGTSFAP
jgi:hypothetical protein